MAVAAKVPSSFLERLPEPGLCIISLLGDSLPSIQPYHLLPDALVDFGKTKLRITMLPDASRARTSGTNINLHALEHGNTSGLR